MDIMDFGIATVGGITLLVYLACLGLRATALDNKWLPLLAGIIGLGLGILGFYTGMPDFPADHPMTAAFVGAASGLAATGINQIAKQLGGGK